MNSDQLSFSYETIFDIVYDEFLNKYPNEYQIFDLKILEKLITRVDIKFQNANNLIQIEQDMEQTAKQLILSKMEEYHLEVANSIKYMRQCPNHEQRSPEWYAARYEKISASSIYKVEKPDNNGYLDLKFEKIGIQMKPFGFNDAIIHGVMFEQVSQVLYETRNKIKISEFGCIPHKDLSYIGASPDGVVIIPELLDFNQNKEYLDYQKIMDKYDINQLILHGRLLEIKNPYSRIIDGVIPDKYNKQINIQQEVCGLPVCDYLETNYIFYDTAEDFFKDTYNLIDNDPYASDDSTSSIYNSSSIENKNIPWVNLGSDGKEKGYLIKFSNKTEVDLYYNNNDFENNNNNNNNKAPEYKYEGILFDITINYSQEQFKRWKEEKIIEMNEKGMEVEVEYYFKVKEYLVQTVYFDSKLKNFLINKSRKLWNEIIVERQLSDQELMDKYGSKIELIEPPLFKLDDNYKQISKKYKNRNIKKYVKPRKEIIKLCDYDF